MTANEILTTIKSRDAALSAEGIAHYAKCDASAEGLRKITAQCWAMVKAGALVAYARRDVRRGGLFFDTKR